MSAADFKPSNVNLRGTFPPLVDTLGRTEMEMAAALIVRACQFHGDAWQPLTPAQLGAAIAHDIDSEIEPVYSMNTNPFCAPDFAALVKAGFATSTLQTGATLELTEEGRQRLARWVRVTPAAGRLP